MFQCRTAGLENAASWALEKRLIEYLERAWSEPDEGIWEIADPPTLHALQGDGVGRVRSGDSKHRGVGREGPLERWREVREAIHAAVCARSFSAKRNSFTQTYESEELDASSVDDALVGFLPADDPRMVGTIAAIEAELLIDDTFVLRYRTHPELDGLPPEKGRSWRAASGW